MRQFFKQTGLHWALTNKTKLKEKIFVLSYVESQRHFILALSELSGEVNFYCSPWSLAGLTDAFCPGQWREVPQPNWWESRFGEG